MSPTHLNPHELDPNWKWSDTLGEWEHKSESGMEFAHKWESPYTVDVFVATPDQLYMGVFHTVLEYFCQTTIPINNYAKHPPGLCVTTEKVAFTHKDGHEFGWKASLLNYPRFPKSKSQILDLAIRLAELLVEKLEQNTALIDAPDATIWVRRKVKLEDAKSAG